MLGRKTALKKMKSIKKIGEAAIGRIFPSVYKPKDDYARGTHLSDCEIPLSLSAKAVYNRSDDCGVWYVSGHRYYAWGIRLGLKAIPEKSTRTLLDELAEFEETTHFIIEESWEKNDYTGRTETITLYRLTYKQELEIYKTRSTKHLPMTVMGRPVGNPKNRIW